ncbi:hypothetical protein VKT23_006915 [Stygiomarasmius scandens]|uniref:Uncharacterized protein n=1 Tax=Marasmiellus scandens TaxID=2682957 RepID=A0ABR1JQY6_9AGAR
MSGTSLKRKLENADAGEVAPAPKKKAAPKKVAATAIGMCSLNKKEFGDRIKDCLRLEKYDIQPMMFSMNMDVAFFRSFFASNPNVKITPQEFDDTTPVVVANLSNKAAGEVFGVSKIKNGNRMSTYDLRAMVVILYPVQQKAQAWVSV